MELQFTGCKHLDFSDSYDAKKVSLGNGSACWERGRTPSLVQFCKLKGRLNDPESCLSQKNKRCGEYDEINIITEI